MVWRTMPPANMQFAPKICLFLGIISVIRPARAFSSSRPPPPQSPYDRRSPSINPSTPPTHADLEQGRGSNLYRPFNPLLGPGSRVAIDGANAPGEGSTLARLITMKLFKSQMRPYLVIPSLGKVPTGLGFDQYRGLSRYICTAPVDKMKEGDGRFPPEIDGLVLCSERGYTAHDVRAILARVDDGKEESRGGIESRAEAGETTGLKRVVMLSSLGVNRREDMMWKIWQFGVDLEARHQAEQELIAQAHRRGFTYTLIRVGPLRGGGGEEGLGNDFYGQNEGRHHPLNPFPSLAAKRDEAFDLTRRGFTFSYCDNIQGETGRVLAAETFVKALGSAHVEDVAIALVSEQGRTWPNFQVAPWDLF